MHRLRWIPLIGLLQATLLLCAVARGQEYLYKRYDGKDGLASSVVFQMLQDKDGFVWFATNAGLSRFDGKQFKTFTVADGLPSNSIIRMFEDSRGRIWLAPFRNAVCYYYQGKIYNRYNDSLLQKMPLDDYVRAVVENNKKELLLTDAKKIYLIDSCE